jgi:hypothetical protein
MPDLDRSAHALGLESWQDSLVTALGPGNWVPVLLFLISLKHVKESSLPARGTLRHLANMILLSLHRALVALVLLTSLFCLGTNAGPSSDSATDALSQIPACGVRILPYSESTN